MKKTKLQRGTKVNLFNCRKYKAPIRFRKMVECGKETKQDY